MNSLRKLRQSKGLKQSELAELLNVTQGALSGWETGRYDIGNSDLIKIADYFGVTVDYLLGREDKNSYSNKEKNELTPQEKEHLKNYRQLDADAKARIDSQIEFELYKQAQSAEKEEANLA